MSHTERQPAIQHIKELKDNVQRLNDEIIKAELLLNQYPDLHAFRIPGGSVGFSTSQINSIVTSYEIKGTYCSFYILPFLKKDGIKLYSSPETYYFYHSDGILHMSEEWEQKLREAKITESIIDEVKKRALRVIETEKASHDELD